MVRIRAAEFDDLPVLADIELAAGAVFRTLGMDAVADDAPPTVAALEAHRRLGQLFVADDEGRVVGYLLVEELDDAAHIEQVSVHPDAARRRIGRDLIEAADVWAADRGLTKLTLTTYRDPPWNAPYYERLGFAVIPEVFQSPELRARRRREAARGLDAWPRVAMERPVR